MRRSSTRARARRCGERERERVTFVPHPFSLNGRGLTLIVKGVRDASRSQPITPISFQEFGGLESSTVHSYIKICRPTHLHCEQWT